MRIDDLTTVELQRLGRWALRSYLDTAAGGQPAGQRAWLAGQAASAELPQGRVDHARIGPVTVLRQGPDRAYVAATVAAGERPAAGLVAAELTTHDGILRVARAGHFPAARHHLDDASRWALEPEPPAHLVRLLGPLPTGTQARACWATAAAIVTDYRYTWGITDPGSALGRQPEDAEQRAERDRAVAATRELLLGIDIRQRRRTGPGREPEGWDLGR